MRFQESFANCPAVALAVWALLLFPWQGVPDAARLGLTGAPLKGAAATPGEATIGDIIVAGGKLLSKDAIISMSGHKVGDPCTPSVLNEMCDKLAGSGNFGMHHPDKPAEWVRVQAEDIGNDKCRVTISVDENDNLTSVVVRGTGPVKPEEVQALLHKGGVYNVAQLVKEVESITDLYNKRGYAVAVGKEIGINPNKPGELIVPIIVSRVGQIEVRKDGVPSTDREVLRQLATRKGDYFNRHTFYEADRKKLLATGRYEDVRFVESVSGPGLVNLRLNLVVKKGNSERRPQS